MSKIPKVILLTDKSRAYGRGLLHGIVQYSNLHGPWLFYIKPAYYIEKNKQLHNWVRNLDIDGIIGYTWDVDVFNMVVNLRLPSIIRNPEKPTSKAIRFIMDQFAAARMAAEYFVRRGFKRFGYCGFDDFQWSKQRSEGFGRAIADYGFETYFYRQPKSKQLRTKDKEQTIIAKWLKSLPKPIAIMAGNDDRSADVLAACKIADIKVPEEVTILGVDNDELICDLSHPQLSSITLSIERAGYEAARVLDKLMKGEKIAESEEIVPIHPLHITTRQSTDITAAEDQLVVEAVKFIHNHSREMIQVTDVAEAVGLSRRALEQRFRRALGHSVLEEIKYHRVNQMANMLIGTNLSISQIARLLGYPDASNISRYFKQQKGISPSDYRKKFGPK